MKAVAISLSFLLLVVSFGEVSAQYHLDEIGFRAGGGANISLPSNSYGLGLGLNANAYYSHYVCGKRWGYHFDAGTTILQADYVRPEINTVPVHIRFWDGGINVGAYLKIRKNNYHRPKETCFMFGPKIHVSSYLRNVKIDASTDYSNRPSIGIYPGLHASAWVRLAMNKKAFWYIIPGVEYYPNINAGSYRRSGVVPPSDIERYNPFYVFINFGMTFWNNR